MGVNDFLIHHQTVDTRLGRHYFDFNDGTSSSRLAPNHRYIFDLLNIDESLYEVEMGFDTELSEDMCEWLSNSTVDTVWI